MSRMFPHHVRVTRAPDVVSPAAGEQNDDGVWTPGTGAGNVATEIVVYDDLADVQDNGPTIRRDAMSGVPVERADARMFLRNKAKIGLIRIGDTVDITWQDGTHSDAEVASVVRLDATVMLRFV